MRVGEVDTAPAGRLNTVWCWRAPSLFTVDLHPYIKSWLRGLQAHLPRTTLPLRDCVAGPDVFFCTGEDKLRTEQTYS